MSEALAAVLLDRALGSVGEKGILTAFLGKMSGILGLAWSGAVTVAIRSATRAMAEKKDTKAGMAVLLGRLWRDLASVTTKKQEKELLALVSATYQTFKKKASRGLGISYNFSQIDKRAVASLGRENPFWVNNLYNTHLSRRISDVGRVLVVEKGLGTIEGAKVMRVALEQELALTGGHLTLADVVPARYAGNVAEYNNILSSNVANRARNFSRMSSLSDGGVERYRITAVLDNRTSEICEFMNGKEFTVSQGLSQMERMIDTDPEGLKEAAPWIPVSQAKKMAGKGSLEKQSGRLADGGQALPPYHGRCRTLVEAV